jgi:hypothetical protein
MKGLSSLYKGLSGVEPTADDIGAVKKAGDTMTGALILSGSPTEPNQAATKSYVDSNSSSWGSIGGTLSNQTDLQNALNAKQDTLVSGTNIKTINSTSILGSGNLLITASAAGTNTQVQFNDNGSIGGDAGLTYDKTTNNLIVGSISLNQSGLVVKGATSNALTIKPNETLSASRTLNLKINDVDRTIDLSGNLTVSSTATISGTNTGDQTNITGNAGTATTLQTARSIYGNNFDGSAALSQIIASTFGGTGNGFTKFTGATSTEKTYTLPNANATILTDNTAVTVPQGGTGLTTLTTAYGVVCAGTTANGSLQNAGAGTSGQYLKSNGASSLPSFASLDLATSTNQGVSYLIPNKNVIINGNFNINQRVVSGTVVLTAGSYGHDRWKAGASGCTYTFSTTNNITTLTISAGSLIQVVEGNNLVSDTYCLSFTGTAQGKIGAGSYGASGITGSATGGTNLNIEFNTGTLSLVQLEKNLAPTPFEHRFFNQELSLCQRYYQKTFDYATAPANNAGLINALSTRMPSSINNNFSVIWEYKVVMRATPSINLFNPSSGTSGYWFADDTSTSIPAATEVNLGSNRVSIANIGLGGIANSDYYIHATATSEL